MALEALAPSEPKSQCAVDAISRWVTETEQLREAVEPYSEDWDAYDSLIREISFRKEKSIRSSIRKLVFTSLQASDPEAELLSRQAVQFYDMRSRLVHDGYVKGEDLGQAITKMREIVFRVLKASFLQIAKRE